MANPNRKMATLRTIDSITPIEGADRIECAHLGGWTVVIGKDEFKPGDTVVYFEVDTFLPLDDARFGFLEPRGTKKMVKDDVECVGHVLRTARLRGQYSQGLVMPVSLFPEIEGAVGLANLKSAIDPNDLKALADEHFDLTDAIGVWEYEPPIPVGSPNLAGKYDVNLAPRTDAERAQNVSQKVFDLMKQCGYYVNVKVDGRSTTLAITDDETKAIRVFSHNYEMKTDEGMGAQILEIAERDGIADLLRERPNLTLQMEFVGPGIQSNRLGLKECKLFVFSAYDRDEKRYLFPYSLGLSGDAVVPLFDLDLYDFATPSDLIEHIDGLRGNVTKDRLDEGIVIHILNFGNLPQSEHAEADAQFHKELGSTFQMKVLNNKYLLKG